MTGHHRAQTAGPPVEPEIERFGERRLTLGGFLLDVCDRYAEREALVFDDPFRGGETVRWTYADLRREARLIGRAVLAAGIGRGERVAILMANRPEAVAAFFGAALAGATVAPLSTFSTRRELGLLLESSQARLVLAQARLDSRDFAADLRELAATGSRRDVVLGEQSWPDFLTAGDSVPDSTLDDSIAAVRRSDEGLIIFSSGTTANPKGVLHGQQAPTLQFWWQAELFARTPETRMWTALPMFWTAGMNTAMGATLAAGGCWVMQEKFDAGDALRLMQRERVTEPYTLPHQARALEEHPDWPTADLSSLRSVFGKSVFARHPTVTGDPHWQMPVGWGMSETCAFISAHPATSPRETMRRSLGRLLPGNQVRVLDRDAGSAVDIGEDGELCIKGPTMMLGYLGKDPAETFDADGWLHTGDIGHLDAAGELHWTGRATEMIKTAGANVSPAEIEVQLRACPPVKLARVLAIPDPRVEQVAVLCVELKAGEQADEAYLRGFLRERVAAYKVPKHVLFFGEGEIPLTASGTKVRDDELRELVLARTVTKQSGAKEES